MTATVTVALGNAFLRRGRRLLEFSQEASLGALRLVVIRSGTVKCREDKTPSLEVIGALPGLQALSPAPTSCPAPRRPLVEDLVLLGLS